MKEHDFFKQQQNFKKMISQMNTKDAMQYLIHMRLFKDEEDCIQHLKRFSNVEDAMKELFSKDCMFPGFDEEYSMINKHQMLDSILTLACRSDKLPYRYFDNISEDCSFLNGDYEYEESNWYLAHEMLPSFIDQIEQTCTYFHYDTIDDLKYLYATDLLSYYLCYIEAYETENKTDMELLKRIKKMFPKQKIPSFKNMKLKQIDTMILEASMQLTSYGNDGYYDETTKSFYTDDDMMYMDIDEEDEIYRIELDKKEILKRFIDRLNPNRYDTDYLYNCFYGRKAFRNCKDAFRKYNILKDYECYEQNEITLACIGWCIKYGYSYKDLQVDIKQLKR